MNTAAVQPSPRQQQSNAPEYQKLLKEKTRDGSSASSSRLRREVHDFRTPRSQTHSRVIHKEKLDLPNSGGARSVSPGRGFSVTGSSSRSEAAPVAHVHPHPSSPGVTSRFAHGAAAATGRVSAPPGLDQHLGETPADRLTRALAESRLSDPIHTAYDARPSIDALWGKPLESRRAASHDNLCDPHQSVALADEATILEPRHVRETDESTMSASATPYLASSESNIRPGYYRDSYDPNVPRLSAASLETLTPQFDQLDPKQATTTHHFRSSTGSHSGQETHSTGFSGYSSSGGVYSQYDGSYNLPPGDTYGSHLLGSGNTETDLTSWQQRHEEQLLQQKLEASRSLRSQRSRSLTQIAPQADAATAPALHDSHRLDAVKRAADNIIAEKDVIIGRQREQLRQQEEYMLALSRGHHFSSRYGEDVRGAFAGSLLTGSAADLEKKLGKTEHDFMEYKKQVLEAEKKHEENHAELQRLLACRESDVAEWKQKYEQNVKKNETAQRELEQLRNYMADLPSRDEQTKTKKEIQSLTEGKGRYKKQCLDLENKLLEAKKSVRSREQLIESVEAANKELQLQMDELTKENKVLREKLSSDVEVNDIRQDNDELREENRRLVSDCDKARKLLEAKHKKLQLMEARREEERAAAAERLAGEEAAAEALRDEVAGKEKTLAKHRASARELGSQNQDLMSKNLELLERVKELEKQHSAEAVRLQQWLQRELGVCFAELDALVHVCLQRAEGQDPNISVLLGPKPGASVDSESGAADTMASLQHKVKRVKELRQKVDDLRGLIANKYADDMGDNLTCATQ